MNFRNWTFLACLFGPRFGFALAVSFYLGAAAVIGALAVATIMLLTR